MKDTDINLDLRGWPIKKTARGKIEDHNWKKQGDHKVPCAICREADNLVIIKGEQELCPCGNEVVICRSCQLKEMRKHLKKISKKKLQPNEKTLLKALEKMAEWDEAEIDLKEIEKFAKKKGMKLVDKNGKPIKS